MKKHYDFSEAEKGKFYRPIEKLEIPVYSDKSIKKFYKEAATRKKIGLNKLINKILKNKKLICDNQAVPVGFRYAFTFRDIFL
jgi:hypothetical protein